MKSNIGHLEPASGMAGLMKLLVAFEHGVIPPSLNFETANPNIPFDELNLAGRDGAAPARPDGVPALAGINSFGFGGTNAHAILAAPPAAASQRTTPGRPLLAQLAAAATAVGPFCRRIACFGRGLASHP